jgi:hypothetical protein
MLQQHQKMMAGQAMQRDPSMDMGQGPQTPGNMDNAPSPSKRPRLDQFEASMAGRSQLGPMATLAANGQLLQNGMTPQQMTAFAQGPNGQIKLEVR